MQEVRFVQPVEVAIAVEKVDTTPELASKIADVIIEIEGKCSGNGQSGERGCFQYLPQTWKKYSTEVSGEILPRTDENERMVAEAMIRKWLYEGVSERGILLTWNQGTPGPDCYKGINKWGVAYDSCDYADRGMKLLEQ